MFKLLDGVTAIGTGGCIKVAEDVVAWDVDFELESLAATLISAATIKLQGAANDDECQTGVITTPTLAVGSTAERVANALFYYRINGTNYSKAAVAAGSVFSEAHVVSATKYGVVLFYVDASGNWITRVPTSPQTYTTAALAHAAGDAMVKMAAHCFVGRVLINADAGDWTANTDDLTDASDLTTATFRSKTPDFHDLETHAVTAGEITAQRGMFVVNTGARAKYVRLFLSALTGTGKVHARLTPVRG